MRLSEVSALTVFSVTLAGPPAGAGKLPYSWRVWDATGGSHLSTVSDTIAETVARLREMSREHVLMENHAPRKHTRIHEPM